MNAYTILRERMPEFSSTEKRIAEYILENGQTLPQTTISLVAQRCQTSKSMIVQLCKRAGFKGYKDLCNRLCVELALQDQKQEILYDDIHPDCTVSQICQITIREEIRSIQDTYEIFDADQMQLAVNALIKADKIVLFGVGNSAVVALDMYNKLWRIGLNVHFSQDTHCQLMETAALSENSVALIFSYNGRTKDMLDACKLAHEFGATVISMTRYGHNPLGDDADVRLYVASNESLMRTSAMGSRLTMLTMVDVLFTCLASDKHADIQQMLKRTASIAATRRK